MRKRMRGRLVTAIIAAGLVGWLALGSPSALADPEVPPPPPAPIDPAAAPAPPPDPVAPPADPLAPPPDPFAPPADPLAPPPPAAPLVFPPPPPGDPLPPPPPARSPPPQPVCAAAGGSAGRRSAHRRPRGHTGRPEPDAVHRRAGVRAAVVQPGEWFDGGCRQADLHQLRAADRGPRDGGAGDPHLVGPAGARQVLLDERHAGALAASELLARQHRRKHRRERRQVELSNR